jgi:hypothetical protein
MSSILWDVQTEKLSQEEKNILLPPLESLLEPMHHLKEVIKKIIAI